MTGVLFLRAEDRSSRVDVHTHARSASDNHVTLTFRPQSVNAYRATATHCTFLPKLVLIAQAVFLLQRGHTHTHTHRKSQTPMTPHPRSGIKKRLELLAPNFVHICCMAEPRHTLTLRSKGQRSRSHGCETCCRCGYACRHYCL